ncbi:MAG: hypothetical protein PVI26_10475, partial [Chitinispirillia bacterium]
STFFRPQIGTRIISTPLMISYLFRSPKRLVTMVTMFPFAAMVSRISRVTKPPPPPIGGYS